MSLLYTLKGLNRERYDPVVAVPVGAPEVVELYRSLNIPIVVWEGIATYEHTTACWATPLHPSYVKRFVRGILQWRKSKRRTRELIARFKPDLVHLNSVVLAASAVALSELGMPFVWHVRESPVNGVFGFRKRFLTGLLKRCPSEVIFLAAADRRAWIEDARGVLVPNFVDLVEFSPRARTRELCSELGFAADAKVLLFVGGTSAIKGARVLLDALPRVKQRFPNLVCLMPGFESDRPLGFRTRIARRILPLLGTGTNWQRVSSKITQNGLTGVVRCSKFTQNLEKFYAAADLLVFPAIRPHFARPVIEAAAMGKPAIASRLRGIEDTLIEGTTGLLFEPGNAEELSAKIIELLGNTNGSQAMGLAGRRFAEAHFDAQANVRAIEAIYERVLKEAE